METAPRNCRFLSLVVVELVLTKATQNPEIHQPGNHPHHHFGSQLGPWSEFCRGGNSDHGLSSLFSTAFTVLLNSGGSNSPWSEFWSEFPHFMGMGVVPAPSRNTKKNGAFTRTLSKVRMKFCLLPCDTSQEPNGNCSEKLVQMNCLNCFYFV